MMINYCLDPRDVAILIDALSEVHEFKSIEIREWTELRYALANLIGSFQDQQPDGVRAEVAKRIDLEDLMAEKLKDMERSCEGDTRPRLTATQLMEFHLENSGRGIVSINDKYSPSDIVLQYRYAFDNSQAWEDYEVQLCTMPTKEIDALTFGDLVHNVTLLGY